MDAHYHIVMKAREDAKNGPSRLYFAYSSVLDRDAFEEWREQHSYQFFDLPEGKLAVAQDVDLIFDFPSRWWGGLVPGLADKNGSQIHGVLFEISSENWPVVQHKEGVISGACVERQVKVVVDGKEIEATAFTTAPHRSSQQGEISEEFIEAWERGARKAGLPNNYIEKVKSVLK